MKAVYVIVKLNEDFDPERPDFAKHCISYISSVQPSLSKARWYVGDNNPYGLTILRTDEESMFNEFKIVK